MHQAQARIEDSRLEVQRRLSYLGKARIRLDVLYFRKDRHRTLDTKLVGFLKNCFQNSGCRPLEPLNTIAALITQQGFDAALRKTGISPSYLLGSEPSGCPELILPDGERLECLHGQHRIQAGREFLRPRDQWWAVDLYLKEANDELKTSLIEEYSNEEKPSDGELYCKIRHYHFLPDRSLESRWESRLRGNRLKNYKSLIRHHNLLDAFDALRCIPGLWYGMRLTTIHTIIAMKCDEQIITYLGGIKSFWVHLLSGDIHRLQRVDQATVEALELRAPLASTLDADDLQEQVLGGKIFRTFTNEERSGIWAKLRLVKGLVPSLFSFFKDVLYLQECADCIRRLTMPSSRDTVFVSLERNFKNINQRKGLVIEQLTEDTFTTRPGSLDDQIDLGIRHLVAFSMRHLYEMPRESEGKDNRMRPIVKADKIVLRKFADLAERAGFESSQISALKQYPRSDTEGQDAEQLEPLLVTNGHGITRYQRCGPPRTKAYQEDHMHLFPRYLHDPRVDQGEGITIFFVLKHIYISFFGWPESCGPEDNNRPRSSLTATTSGNLSPHANQPSPRSRENSSGTTERFDNMDEDTPQPNTAGNLRTDDHYQRAEQERLVRENQAAENAAWVNLRVEQEKLRTERERLEAEVAERVEREMADREKVEAERLGREKWLAELAERAKQDAERAERETQEIEKREKREADQVEREKLEAERVEQEKLRLEQEKLRVGWEMLEAERARWEKQEGERLQRETEEAEKANEQEAERIEREKQEAERLERDKKLKQLIEPSNRDTQFELERFMISGNSGQEFHHRKDPERENITSQDRIQSTNAQNLQTENLQSRRKSQRVQEMTPNHSESQTISSQRETNLNDQVRIEFKIKERGVWRVVRPLVVSRSDPSEVERVARKYVRKGLRLFNTQLGALNPKDCFYMVLEDGTKTILLMSQEEKQMVDELVDPGETAEGHPSKRQA